jgi:hypothetical protein
MNHCPVAGSQAGWRFKCGKKYSGGNGLTKTVPPLFSLGGFVDKAARPEGSAYSSGTRRIAHNDDPETKIWTMH